MVRDLKRGAQRYRRGVTVVELMMVVAVLGLIVSVIPTVTRKVLEFMVLQEARREIQKDARASMDMLNRFLRQAYSTRVTVSRHSASQPPYSKIEFYTVDNTTHTFYQEGKILWHAVNNGTPAKMSSYLRFMGFSYPRTDDKTIVSVSLTFERFSLAGKMKSLQMAVEQVRVMN